MKNYVRPQLNVMAIDALDIITLSEQGVGEVLIGLWNDMKIKED